MRERTKFKPCKPLRESFSKGARVHLVLDP